MDETLINQGESEKSAVKWPLVSFRISQEDLDEILYLTGETSGGKAAKAAVLEYIKIKREGGTVEISVPPAAVEMPPEHQTSAPVQAMPPPAQPQPAQGEAAYLPKLVETLSVLAQNLQQPQRASAPARELRPSEIQLTPEQEALRNSRKITEADFRAYFKRMRIVGQKDATEKNEEAFWQYLIAADFNKMDGTPITKQGLASSFIAWVRMRDKEARELAERKSAEAEAKSAAEKEAAAQKAANEAWNDMMLRSEKNVNWDEE